MQHLVLLCGPYPQGLKLHIAEPLGKSGKVRAVTKKQISAYFAKFGRKGCKASAAKLSPEQRQASARRAAHAR